MKNGILITAMFFMSFFVFSRKRRTTKVQPKNNESSPKELRSWKDYQNN